MAGNQRKNNAEIEAIKEMLEAEEQELRWTCAPGCIIAASSLSL